MTTLGKGRKLNTIENYESFNIDYFTEEGVYFNTIIRFEHMTEGKVKCLVNNKIEDL